MSTIGVMTIPTAFLQEFDNEGADWLPGGADTIPVVGKEGKYIVTADIVADEIITVGTGATNGNGNTVLTGDTVSLGVTASEFNTGSLLQIYLNGVKQLKGTDVVWDSETTFHFTTALDIDDRFSILVLK